MKRTQTEKQAYAKAKAARLVQSAHDSLEMAINDLGESDEWGALLPGGKEDDRILSIVGMVIAIRNELRRLGAKQER